jgi:hypothetical protein
MTVAAYYADHQVDGRAFIQGRPGCWFTRDKCAVVTADQGYRYCTASGYTMQLQAGACVLRYLEPSPHAKSRGLVGGHKRYRKPLARRVTL